MLKKLSTLFTILAVLSVAAFAQDAKTIQAPKTIVTGEEVGNVGTAGSSGTFESINVPPVIAGDLVFNFVGLNVFTGYDLQSNGTTQQIWVDPTEPDFVHMVFTRSAETAGWSDRDSYYFFSDDGGSNWLNLGEVQTGASSRGGFPAITGLSNGTPIVAHHTNDEVASTIAQIYKRDVVAGSWTRYDPGAHTDGNPIWPRVVGIGTDDVVMAASINGAPNDDFFTNVLDLTAGTYAGWVSHKGDQAETHNVATSDDETIVGLAHVGNGTDSARFGNAYYRESLDGGLSWSDEVKIWSYDYAGDSLGAMRGIDIVFLNNDPYVVFEVIKQDFGAASYFPSFPNAVYLWSPALNGGTAVLIADSNNIPFHENPNAVNDVQGPIGRPSIGRSVDNKALFVTINATTADRLVVGTNEHAFYAGWFMYSTDGGNTFSAPEQFTPATPIKDWKYLSLNPVSPIVSDNYKVMMSAQADTIPGSTVNAPAPPWPTAVSAEYVFVSTTVPVVSGVDDNQIVTSYSLEQNYPNPFNPSTTIRFSVPERSDVSLKIFDVLGNEVAELINETKEAGSYDVAFNSSNLASGMYLYTLKAGSFTSTKKMIFLK